MTLPNDQEQTSNVPVRFTELDQIKQNVQEIKTSVDQYKQQKDFLDKKKSTLAKDVVKQKQSLIDAKELEIEAKKKETLALIAKLKIDTKLTVLDTTISQEIAADESYLKTLNIKDSSFWEKTYCWMKEHKKGLFIGGALVSGFLFLKNLFKKDEDTKNEKEDADDRKKKKKQGEKKSRWKKALIGVGILGGTVGAGILGYKYWPEIKGWFLDLVGKNLTFDEALIKVKSDLGGVSESDMNVALGLEYIEAKGVIKSYGEEIKIDKNKKRVEGLDVSFSNYEEMIHAANIINYSKASYKGKCVSDTPFYIKGGDIEVKLLDAYKTQVISGEGVPVGAIAGAVVGSIGALAAGYFAGPRAGVTTGLGAIPAGILLGHYIGDGRSTLAKICPKLADGLGKEKLLVCLNSIQGLTQGKQEHDPDNKTPLQKYVNEVIQEIENTEFSGEFDDQGKVRSLTGDIDPQDPTSYTIKSRGRLGQTKLTFVEGKIKIDGLDIEFTDLKEGIRVANLTNKIKCEYAGKCTKQPFSYKSGLPTMGHSGLYASDGRTNPIHWTPYRIISEGILESRYPTLLKNIESSYIPYLHKMKNTHNRSLWIMPN